MRISCGIGENGGLFLFILKYKYLCDSNSCFDSLVFYIMNEYIWLTHSVEHSKCTAQHLLFTLLLVMAFQDIQK